MTLFEWFLFTWTQQLFVQGPLNTPLVYQARLIPSVIDLEAPVPFRNGLDGASTWPESPAKRA